MVWAEAPPLRTAGELTVVIDGAKAGTVMQGTAAPFPLAPGRHTVRVGARGWRSNTSTVEVAEGGTVRLAVFSTGLSTMGAILPVLGLLGLIPGLIYRLRPLSEAPAAESVAAAEEASAATGSGLWWESDPKLAKRYGGK
ncbi:hypothetical protein FHX73_1274 [Kitasatospora viridis]|uniref:PEGA domain-containing protein n=2 Tax=Kitasatospora viridis TaxID=281105 RepID=A0A561TV23_9ACTN|nr:hypothetical protein FHX73_1274 [Kitasatospora viridis]